MDAVAIVAIFTLSVTLGLAGTWAMLRVVLLVLEKGTSQFSSPVLQHASVYHSPSGELGKAFS